MVHRRTIERNYTINKIYTEKIIEIICKFDIYIFAIVMDKPDFIPNQTKGKLPIQYLFLLERLNSFGYFKQTQVLLVYDKIHDAADGLIGDGMKNYLFKHPNGRLFNNIIHMPLFVSSANNTLIRFPDLTGNILRQYYGLGLDRRTYSNKYEEWIFELASKVKSKTIQTIHNPIKNCFDYGIYFMRKELFQKSQDESL